MEESIKEKLKVDDKKLLHLLAKGNNRIVFSFKEEPKLSIGDIVDLGSVKGTVYKTSFDWKSMPQLYSVYVQILSKLELSEVEPKPFEYLYDIIIPRNEIIVISGMSGAGKDTLAQMLSERNDYGFVVSTTTRPPRPYESEGLPYYFVNEKTFFETKMIEQRSYPTLFDGKEVIYYYGVTESEISPYKKYAVVLDAHGTQEFISHFGDRVIPIFIDASEYKRKSRSIFRGGHDESEWNRREIADTNSFAKSLNTLYRNHVSSEDDDVERAYKECINIIESEIDNRKSKETLKMFKEEYECTWL